MVPIYVDNNDPARLIVSLCQCFGESAIGFSKLTNPDWGYLLHFQISRLGSSSDSPPVLSTSSSSRPTEREDVCPWESISPPSAGSSSNNRIKSVLLTPGPSVDHHDGGGPALQASSPLKTAFERHPSTDLDVCPWESASAVLPAASGGGTRTRTPVPQQKSSTEVVSNDDVVCPWESQEPAVAAPTPTPQPITLPAATTGSAVTRLHPDQTQIIPPVKTSSEVTAVIMLNPSKQASPVISPAGGSTSSASSGSGHKRKESASGLTVQQQQQPESSEQTAAPQLDKSSAKISDICPWEDE